MFYVRISSVSRRCASRDSTNQNASFVDWFSRLERAVLRGTCGEMFASFQASVGNFDTIPPWKVVWTLILIALALLLNILLSWAFVTSLNCSVKCKPPWWFDRNFRCSSWIHSWLLAARFCRIISVNLLLQPFFFVDFGVYPGLPLIVSPSVGGVGRLSQRVAQVRGNGLSSCFRSLSIRRFGGKGER